MHENKETVLELKKSFLQKTSVDDLVLHGATPRSLHQTDIYSEVLINPQIKAHQDKLQEIRNISDEIRLPDGGQSYLNELPIDDQVAEEEESKDGTQDVLQIVMEKFNLS